MDCEMENADCSNNKDITDASIDVEWQIDSEWINLTSSPSSLLPANNKKARKITDKLTDFETESTPAFHFISSVKGDRFLVVDNKALRLCQKKTTGYSYWVCSIPCCTARCVLDPEEKKIVRFFRDHNHEGEISRQEYKKFINALKIAVKENPHVKPKVLYDMELEKLREKWREKNLRNSTNEEEPCLPSFETVRTAMYNSRNAVLSAVSLRATENEGFPAEVEPAHPSRPSRSTRSRDAKSNLRQKTTPSKGILCSPNLDDLVEVDEDECDEEEHVEGWTNSSPWKSSRRQVSEDITFYFLPSSRGSHVLVIDGCILHQNTTRTSGMSYWRCQKKGCFFRAVYDPVADKVTKTAGLHNHPPDSNQMLRRQFINNVKSQITENPHLPAKQIYEKEVQKVHQELDGLGVIWKVPPFSSVKHHVYKAQRDASKTDDEEEPDEDTSEGQVVEPIKREITETEKKFLEESSPLPQEEETGLNSLLLSPGPTAIHSTNFPDLSFYFIPSKRGKRILVVNEFTFRLNNQKSGGRYYWKCTVDPCMFRCVYNENLRDLVKVSGKHTHASNINRLRVREFYSLMKARMAQDPSLIPKKAYDQEVAKISSLENGEALVKCLPAYSSIRTSLYNQKRKKVFKDEQTLLPGSSTVGSGYNNNYSGTSFGDAHTQGPEANLDQAQDISPKDITQLSLEDNDPMEHEEDDRGALSSSSSSSNPMEIAAPSLYDNHDIIGQYCSLTGNAQPSTQEENNPETHLVTATPDLAVNSVSFLPTARGGRALVVNGCLMRINYIRDFMTYWKCPNTGCHFRCSYDSKRKHLIRISGEHNHTISTHSSVIRIFVQKLKKRVSQENKLSPKIIYDEEVARVKGEETDVELLKRLPTYESLKSTLYKVKNKPARAASVSAGDHVDFLLEASEDEKQEDENCTDTADVRSVEEPPYDPFIEEVFSVFNSQLPSWTGQDADKRLLDGHLLVKKSTAETSTGWSCSKEDCPFRCVVDTETSAITRSQWDHTHKSVVKQIIAQTMLSAVRRRAVTDDSLLPKVIFKQERKRIVDKLSGNKTLIKFIPNLTQVYQLITKTRANPRPPPKPTASHIKLAKQVQKKKCSQASESNMNVATSISCTGAGHFDADCLLEQGEDDGNKLTAYPVSMPRHQQRGLTFTQEPCQNFSSTSLLDGSYGTIPYQPPDFDHTINSFTNTAPADAFTSAPQQSGGSRFILPDKSSHYVAREPYLNQHEQMSQQQESSTVVSAAAPPLLPPLPLTQQPAPVPDPPSSIQIPHSVLPDSESMFLLHGYPVKPTTTSEGSIYWQCHVLGCGFHCVFNTETSQIVKASGSHNHAPPTGSQSAFSSQLIKVLQKKAIENLDQPLSSVYWEYVNSLRDVLQSEEIMNSLPRFQDVMSAMQSSRTSRRTDDTTHQVPNLIVGSAVHSNRVYEFHYDAQLGSLLVNGDTLVRHWRMNEMSYWRCQQVDCRFKCVLDDELQCVHILNPHTHPCPSYAQEDDRHCHTKRKSSDKPSAGRLKIPRIE